MSTSTARAPSPSLEIVELDSVRSAEMERFLLAETALWGERLYWDVSGAVAALSRAVERGGIDGKALRYGSELAAFSYYSVEGGRGVISGFLLAPEGAEPDPPASRAGGAQTARPHRVELARTMLDAVLAALLRKGVRRIESQFLAVHAPWLVPCFESRGFRTHWRDFLRLRLVPSPRNGSRADVTILPWRAWNLSEATLVMRAAHERGADAAMNELYRSTEGCRLLLNNIVRQRGCGLPVTEASAVARQRRTDRAVGFALVTETAKRQAHLAQLAVSPSAQRQGVGRALLSHSANRLHELGFETLSLMVTSANFGALALYRSFGFEPVLRFPVFCRER